MKSIIPAVILAVAGVIGIGGDAAAQINPDRLNRATLTREDIRHYNAAVADLLNTGSEGESRQWQNPENGHGGTITIERSLEVGGAACRDLQSASTIDRRPQQTSFRVCRQPDGTWRITE